MPEPILPVPDSDASALCDDLKAALLPALAEVSTCLMNLQLYDDVGGPRQNIWLGANALLDTLNELVKPYCREAYQAKMRRFIHREATGHDVGPGAGYCREDHHGAA